MNTQRLLDTLRASPWLLIALVALALVTWWNPDLPIFLVWATAKLALGAFLGYWVDRSIFHYSRPGSVPIGDAGRNTALLIAASMLRRALIMAATIVAIGLGAP